MEAASDTLLSLGSPVANIHYERFDFGAGEGRIDKHRRAAALSILAVVAASALVFSQR
jgi:hypothetical protein